jgi:hypothetical protein
MFEFLLRRHIPDWALRQYREGLLDRERSEMFERHLLLCPTCQLQIEDLLPPASDLVFTQLGTENQSEAAMY